MASHRYYQNVTFSKTSPVKLKARSILLRPLSLGYRRSSTVKQSLCPARAVHIKRRVLCSSFLEKNETGSEQDSEGRKWKLLLWSTLDVTATLGSVGGAVAFILTQEAMLIGLPLVLPLLALYASRRRESLKLQIGLREIRESWGLVTQQLDKHEEVKVQELQQAFKLWREDLQKQLPSGKLKSIESKLAALEGSVLSAGRSAQSAARNVEMASNNMAEITAAQMKDLGTRLVKELQQDLQAKSQAPTEELKNLASRLEGIESSLQGLEEGQVQGMRRLAQSIMGAVEEAEASLQSTMQADARRSFDALQRLPALLAAALPVTDVTPMLADRTQPAALAQIAPADRAWLQGVVENALQLATERVLEKQQDRAALPAVLADEQWDALGKRLRGIEQSVQDLLEGSGGEDVPAREEALVTEMAALRDDVSSALKGIRESDGVSPELAPLLSSINGSLEALRSQVETPLSAAEAAGAQNGALSGALLPIKAALAELQSSQASLQLALQSASETSSGTVASAGVSVEEAARRAAKEVLREFSAQTPDVAELRETISATLAAVRQLEAATMERIASLAATINTLPSDSSPAGGMQKSLPESSASQAGADAPPKGYKGDPSDTREDAYARMQALLNAGKKASAEVAPVQPGTPSTPQMDSSKSFEDLVPISAWLGESPGADESRSERELASSYAEASSNGAASYPSPSQPAPETTSIYSTSEKVSQNQSGPSTSSSAPEQAPGKQPEVAAGPFQDDERGQQLGSFGDDRGSRNQQFSGSGVSMPGPTEADRDALAAATPSVSNGSTTEAGGGEEELEALVAEGKQLLREGRQLTKAGYDLGAADLALQDAMACFEEAAQIDSASIKVQGNWGNALMAYGVLKKRYLSELRDAPPPRSYEERAAARAAEEQLTDEAEAALVAAGQRFLAVVERDQDDTRALANWGRALCLRAELARDPEVACALYEAAVAKFEAVLEADPSNRAVLRNCAFALFDLARLQPDPTSRASRQLLEDAARYLEDVLTINGSDEDAAIALDQCIAELDQGRAVRR